MIKIAVIGAGHWGPNLIRNFNNKQRSEVVWVADLDQNRLQVVGRRFPEISVTSDPLEVLSDKSVVGVVIATPTTTHHELVKAALERGKHVLVEKPLTQAVETSEELVELASKKDRTLLVGHVFLYNPAVQWVKGYLQEGDMGAVYYVSSLRTNLGPVRLDVNASWDLAAQDISIFNYWLDSAPVSVSAAGGNWINDGLEDAVFATLRYPSNVLAHLHVSWLNPRKVRDITVVAAEQMLTYDDMSLTEPIRVYDKQVTHEPTRGVVDSFASFRSSVREGVVTIPPIKLGEPLANECDHFLDCIEHGVSPQTGGAKSLEVVRALDAIDRSIGHKGREVEL